MKTEEFLNTFKVLDKKRWELVEKKYRFGLTKDEHEYLEMLSTWCWQRRKPGDASAWPSFMSWLHRDFTEYRIEQKRKARLLNVH